MCETNNENESIMVSAEKDEDAMEITTDRRIGTAYCHRSQNKTWSRLIFL